MSKKNNTQDTSVHIHQKEKYKGDLQIRDFNWTEKQKNFLQISTNKQTKVCIVDGLWGTAKTLLAVKSALTLLKEKKVSDIIYIRNPVESTTTGKIGFIPGSIEEKFQMYAQPLYDKLEELISKPEIERLKKENRIHAMPIGFLRGLSWNCKAIIVDEASCFTLEDLLLIISRVGEFSKIYFVGDNFQNDIGAKSGFSTFFNLFNDQESRDNGIFTFEFKDEDDILRSELLGFVMKKIKTLKKEKTTTPKTGS